jgi:hypothetical protein
MRSEFSPPLNRKINIAGLVEMWESRACFLRGFSKWRCEILFFRISTATPFPQAVPRPGLSFLSISPFLENVPKILVQDRL